jgi:putative ABC transport system permease protein
LAAFTAEVRTKEIGVRKVLGASVTDIVSLLSRDLARLVVIAFVLAAPLAYLVMRWWLQDFAYRTDVGPATFAAAGILAFVTAMATVSYHSIKAATADPVKSLRYE